MVIDPEDREQVKRLLRAYFLLGDFAASVQPEEVESMQAALREFANPKPPKPDEPTGLGAVGEDAEGGKWVHVESRTGWWWRNSAGETCRWPDVDAVRELSAGVEVES